MKITIKTNGKFHKAKIQKENNEIYGIEFNFDKVYAWSDLEFYLEDEDGNYCDHMTLNVSKRNKLKAQK